MHLFIENLCLHEARELLICKAVHPLYAAVSAKLILEKGEQVPASIFYVPFYEDEEYDTPEKIAVVNERREEEKQRAIQWLNEHCATEDAVDDFVSEYMYKLSETSVKVIIVDMLDSERNVDYKWIWDDKANTYHYLT